MLSVEKLWNAAAVGGVVSALVVTAGVVNLGSSPSSPQVTGTSVSPVAVLGGSGEVARAALAPAQTAPAVGTAAPSAGEPQPSLLQATLTTPDGPSPVLRAHEEIRATLLTTADAYVYCFYADGAGSVSRIFPNRFQPEALVRSGALRLPDATGAITLVADRPGATEEMRCMASTADLGASLPAALMGEDLSPLAVGSLDEISAMFSKLGQGLVETRLVATVLPEPSRPFLRDTFASAAH